MLFFLFSFVVFQNKRESQRCQREMDALLEQWFGGRRKTQPPLSENACKSRQPVFRARFALGQASILQRQSCWI